MLVEEGVAEDSVALRAADAVVRKVSGKESHLVVTLLEGRNREVRRLVTAAGREVRRPERVAFEGLDLGDLKAGSWRGISSTELSAASIEGVSEIGKRSEPAPCYAQPAEER